MSNTTARLRLKLLASPWLLAALPLQAQGFATRPVRIITPFSPGGSTDVLARALGEGLQRELGQPIVVENKTGAGSVLGNDTVSKSPPDGHTLLLTTGAFAIVPSLNPKLPYSQATGFTPITVLGRAPNVLIVRADSPLKSGADLLAQARAKPGQLTYGSSGNGSSTHLSTELLKVMAKVFITHIPYRGSGPALADLIAGQVQMTIDNLPSALPHIRSGKLVALAVTAPSSVAALPDVPPLGQFLKGYSAESWFVLMAPAGTPKAIIDRVSTEADQILKKPEIVERMRGLGATGVGGTPQALGDFIAAETTKWREVVKVSGAKLD